MKKYQPFISLRRTIDMQASETVVLSVDVVKEYIVLFADCQLSKQEFLTTDRLQQSSITVQSKISKQIYQIVELY